MLFMITKKKRNLSLFYQLAKLIHKTTKNECMVVVSVKDRYGAVRNST